MIISHLIAILLGNAPLTAAQASSQTKLLALVPPGQIVPKKLTQGTSLGTEPNGVTISQRTGGHVKTLSGREGTAKALFDVVVYADDTPTADKIFQRVSEVLDCYSATVSVGTDTVQIKGIFQQEDETNGWLAAVNADEVGRHYAGGTFLAWSTEQS